ncbi:MAG: hypothetical protein PHO87_05455 [Acholeplasmataceae bacterium]|nr:hypothetical protein [Acholeplasmataceae bacterium]MDD4469497.1 hypothetical protein [Acholeplasmataceae bacterium]
MVNNLEYIYTILNEVLPNNVYYAVSIKDNIELPIIVYQELNKRGKTYADDSYLLKELTIQITLITPNKNIQLEKMLENKLKLYDIEFQMISEFYIAENGLYRIYEIKMEESKYEQ